MKKSLTLLLATAFAAAAADHARAIPADAVPVAQPTDYIINGQTYRLVGNPAPAAPVAVPAVPVAPAAPVAPLYRNGMHSVEVALVSRYAINKIDSDENSDKIDVGGIDVTYVYQVTPNHGFFARMGCTYGELDYTEWGMAYYEHDEIEVSALSLTAGYRASLPVSDRVTLFGAAGVGLNFENVSADVDAIVNGQYYRASIEGDDVGLGFSLELGVRARITNDVSLFAAYEFTGSTAKPSDTVYGVKIETKEQYYNGFRFGVGVSF